MEDLVNEWNTSCKNRHGATPRLQGSNKEMWTYISKLLSMKKCALRCKNDSKNIVALTQRRDSLSSEVQSLKIASRQLASDINLLQKETIDLKKKNDDTLRSCQSLSIRTEVMKVKSLQCSEETRVINEYHSRLAKLLKENNSRGDTVNNPCDNKTESACTVEDEVQACFSDLLKASNSDDGKEHRRIKVESVIASNSPLELIQALVTLAERATSKLKRSRDSFPSCSGQQSRLESLEKHVQELQLYHIKKSQDILDNKSKIAHSQKILTELSKTWEREVVALDLENKDLLLKWFQLCIQLSGYEAALREMGVVCDGVEHLCEERRKTADELKGKISRMQQFRDIVGENQNKINTIVKHNSSAKETLKARQSQIQAYIRQKFQSLTDTTVICAELKDGLLSHVMLLSTQPTICCPPSLKVDSFKCSESSITQLTDKLRAGKEVAECCHVVEKELNEMKQIDLDPDHVSAVLKESGEFVEAHEGHYYDRADSLLTVASKGVAGVSETQLILEEWWKQPSQSIVHWKTVEDMNVAQWVEQWRILATKYAAVTMPLQFQTGQIRIEDTNL